MIIVLRYGGCRGKSASTNTYGDRAPSLVRRGRRSREERIEAMHTRDLPSFGPQGCVKPYCCFVVLYCVLARERVVLQYTRAAGERERGWIPFPPPRCAWGLLLYVQGVTHRWQRRRGQ